MQEVTLAVLQLSYFMGLLAGIILSIFAYVISLVILMDGSHLEDASLHFCFILRLGARSVCTIHPRNYEGA